MPCVNLLSYSILINSELEKPFDAKNGFSQGNASIFFIRTLYS